MEIKNQIIQGDTLQVLKTMPDDSFDTIITSPPYWNLRDYGVEGQIGLEKTLDEYLEKLLAITQELQRVLKPTGVMYWNHGDCYGGIKTGKTDKKVADYVKDSQKDLKKYAPKFEKCMMLQNYRLLLRMCDEQNWIIRNILIWAKPNHMPSSVKDRLSNAYEPVFFLTKNKHYYFDLNAIRKPHKESSIIRYKGKYAGPFSKEKTTAFAAREADPDRKLPEGGKNPGDVWRITTQPVAMLRGKHFATFPEKLVEPMILSGCPKGGLVLDPFGGAMTTAVVAKRLGRNYTAIELNPDYVEIGKQRIRGQIRPML